MNIEAVNKIVNKILLSQELANLHQLRVQSRVVSQRYHKIEPHNFKKTHLK